jgi:hypothetical protein
MTARFIVFVSGTTPYVGIESVAAAILKANLSLGSVIHDGTKTVAKSPINEDKKRELMELYGEKESSPG